MKTTTTPLRSLIADLARTPALNDAAAIADYRALCRLVMEKTAKRMDELQDEAALLAVSGMPAMLASLKSAMKKFPQRPSIRFAIMGRQQLVTWARQFRKWLAGLHEGERALLGNTIVALK